MNQATTIEVDGQKRINVLVFLEDGKHLLSGGEDGMIRQWHVEDRKEIEDQRLTASSAVRAIALSGDGNWIISAGQKMATAWDRKTRQGAYTVSGHTDWVVTVDVSPDSAKFATGSKDTRVVIWAVSNGRRLIEIPNPMGEAVIAVRFSSNGEQIAVATGKRIQIHDAYGGLVLTNLWERPHSQSYNSFAWSSDFRLIFALASNVIQDLRINDKGRCSLLTHWTIPGHSFYLPTSVGIALSSGTKFVAAFTCRALTFWDKSTCARLGPVFEHLHVSQLCSIALSPGDNYVATGSTDGIITLFNLNGIIPSSLLCYRRDPGFGGTHVQAEACYVTARAGQSSSDGSTAATAQPNDRARGKVTLQFIPDGIYRIKSNAGDLYLTGPHAGAGAVIVQPMNQSSVFQKWTVSLVADGAYDIVNTSELQLTVGTGVLLLAGQKGTTWTFDSRGDAFVIGNAANIMAIQLEPGSSSVFVLPRSVSAVNQTVREVLALTHLAEYRTVRINGGSLNLLMIDS